MRRLLQSIFGARQSTTRPGRRRRGAPAVEGLERRENPSSYVQSGVLYIVGGEAADRVTVHYRAEGYASGYYQPAALEVRENGAVTAHALNSYYYASGGPRFSRIEFYGNGGDDYFNDYSNAMPIWAFGNAGNDILIGYNHDDWLVGGTGDDTLQGYDGRDILNGGDGADNLWGDGGDDSLSGGNQMDRLFGGPGRDTLSAGADLDVIDGGPDFDTYRDEFDLSRPFYGGQAVEDVRQQDAPTCQTLAAMASATLAGHDFSTQITYQGGTQYRVRIYPGGTPTDLTLTFDGTWSDNDPAPARDSMGRTLPEFWTILMQRARLQPFNVDWQTERTAAQWQTIMNTNDFRMSRDAMRTLVGRTATQTPGIPAPQTFQGYLANRRMVQVATPATLPAGAPVVANHVYAVSGVWQGGPGIWLVSLYNPQGFYQTLNWDQFTANFIETAVA